jgi:cell division protein FtsW
MRARSRVDLPLLLAVLCLMAVGVDLVYSASAVKAGMDPHTGNWEFYFLRQAAFGMMGILALVACWFIPYPAWERKAGVLYLFTVALLVLVLLVAKGGNGAYRWIPLGPVNLQPSEFAKLAVALYLARFLSRRGEEMRERPASVLRPLLLVSIPAGLILLERDLGTALFVFLLALGLFFLAGVRGRVLAAGVAALALLAALAVAAEPYRRDRVVHFISGLRGESAPASEKAEPTQVDQSLAAFANGGLLGKGPGLGDSKRMFLPEAHTDFILAVIGEEMGALGLLGVLALFAVIVWRGFRIALAAPDPFGTLLAAGITLVIGLGALLNTLMVTGLIPPKGIALPFLSYGGSSLIASMMGVGVLLNISGRRATA